jgi:hypothetical protein
MKFDQIVFGQMEENAWLVSRGIQVGRRGSSTNHDVAVTPIPHLTNVRLANLGRRLRRQKTGEKKAENNTKMTQRIHPSSEQ